MTLKPQTDFESFLSLDVRSGVIIKAEESLSTKPTYRFTVDFGPEVGEKVTVAAMTHYNKEDLVGLKIIGLINVGSRKMGPEKSEFLFLAVPNEAGDAVPLVPYQDNAKLGGELF